MSQNRLKPPKQYPNPARTRPDPIEFSGPTGPDSHFENLNPAGSHIFGPDYSSKTKLRINFVESLGFFGKFVLRLFHNLTGF